MPFFCFLNSEKYVKITVENLRKMSIFMNNESLVLLKELEERLTHMWRYL